ncbi:MAG: RNA 3'-terminal phosphate cyclase [Thermocladium sp.]
MPSVIEIDGSMGEGGGQILRTAVSLSAVIGVPVRIRNIRAKRNNPGLRMQHITAISAAAKLSSAEVIGMREGSMEVTFIPGKIVCSNQVFDVGTAGSISLIIQTIMPILMSAGCGSIIELRGGTDVPMAPPIDYMANVVVPNLELMGMKAMITTKKRGHYPRGGGSVVLETRPSNVHGISFRESRPIKVEGISHATNLPSHVATRQAAAARNKLMRLGLPIDIRIDVGAGLSPGSGIVVWGSFDDGHRVGGDALGELGKPAEAVGSEAADKLLRSILSGADLDPNMGDMMVTYAAVASEPTRYTVSQVTQHLLTNVRVIKLMGINAEVKGEVGGGGEVIVEPTR